MSVITQVDQGKSVAVPSFPPLHAWEAIKIHLRRELGEKEWEMWIRHARLMRVTKENRLMVVVPNPATFGALRQYKRLRREASKLGLALDLTNRSAWDNLHPVLKHKLLAQIELLAEGAVGRNTYRWSDEDFAEQSRQRVLIACDQCNPPIWEHVAHTLAWETYRAVLGIDEQQFLEPVPSELWS